jgi:endonuclease/exonuclease/phosphatase family metal-dependent hydrolase
MKKYFNYFILNLLFVSTQYSQDLTGLSYGQKNTLDIATWNIEWFPKNDQITVNLISEIISRLNFDIIAIQEIDDVESFDQMMDLMPSYLGYYESNWFAGLAFIYNQQTVSVNNIFEIYTTEPYWSAFPRSPMVMDIQFYGNNYFIINNHFKCCGDGFLDLNDITDEENRRYIAMNLLKEYMEENLSEEKVVIVGDLNDDISEISTHNIFQNIINDSLNYRFSDYPIAIGESNNWSFPNWPSHLDHILISNEIFDNVIRHFTKTIKIDSFLQGGWAEYDQNISDHRPVAIKIIPEISFLYDLNNDSEINFLDIETLRLSILNEDLYLIDLDYNSDSEIDLIDLIKLYEYVVF